MGTGLAGAVVGRQRAGDRKPVPDAPRAERACDRVPPVPAPGAACDRTAPHRQHSARRTLGRMWVARPRSGSPRVGRQDAGRNYYLQSVRKHVPLLVEGAPRAWPMA